MVYLVGGYLFTYQEMRQWARVHGEELPKDDCDITIGLYNWFKKKKWTGLQTLGLDWPQPSRRRGTRGVPKIMVVLHRRELRRASRNRYPEFKQNDDDRYFGAWLAKQGIKVPWVTVPDPYGLEDSDDEDENMDEFKDEWVVRKRGGSRRKTGEKSPPETGSGSLPETRHGSGQETRAGSSQQKVGNSSQRKTRGISQGNTGDSFRRETRSSSKRKAEVRAETRDTRSSSKRKVEVRTETSIAAGSRKKRKVAQSL